MVGMVDVIPFYHNLTLTCPFTALWQDCVFLESKGHLLYAEKLSNFSHGACQVATEDEISPDLWLEE